MKGYQETLAGDGYVNYLHYGDDFTRVYVCQTYQILHHIHVHFIKYQLYITKATDSRTTHLRQWLGHKQKEEYEMMQQRAGKLRSLTL